MIRPTVARVDLAAIESNLGEIQRFLSTPAGSAPRIIAVVKANAYGHGASEVGLALERAGAAMLACADIEEGIVLRRAGVRIPILVFGALGISDLDGVFVYDLTPTISTPAAAQNLAAATRKHATTASSSTPATSASSSTPAASASPLTPAVSASSSSPVVSAFRRKLRCHL